MRSIHAGYFLGIVAIHDVFSCSTFIFICSLDPP